MIKNSCFIAKEGKCLVYSLCALFFIVWIVFGFCPFLLFVALAFIFIYRNPERDIEVFEEGALYSMADSKIKSISVVDDCDIGSNSTLLVFKKRFFDCGVLRALTDMKIDSIVAIKDKSKINTTVIDELDVVADINGTKIKIILKKNLIAKNIYFYDNKTIRFKDRIGFLLCGEIGIIVPSSFRIEHGVGDSVKANSRLGYFTN